MIICECVSCTSINVIQFENNLLTLKSLLTSFGSGVCFKSAEQPQTLTLKS